MQNPRGLIQWLYEEQGERRFDAANRLFLILVDENNLEDSWKMKRNINLLKNKINNYMDDSDFKNKNRFKIIFNWKDRKQYSAFSDIVFITKK